MADEVLAESEEERGEFRHAIRVSLLIVLAGCALALVLFVH